MVQAAARRVVDFSMADILDRKWWLRLWWMLDQVESDNIVRVKTMQHLQNSGALNYESGDKVFGVHWDQCNTSCIDVWNELFSWRKHDPQEQTDFMYRAWVAKYGDPDDPETKERIARTAEVMQEMREKQLNKLQLVPRRVLHKTKKG